MICMTPEEMIYFLELTGIEFKVISESVMITYGEVSEVWWGMVDNLWCPTKDVGA